MKIDKKDWEDLKRDAVAKLKQSLISTMQFELIIKLCEDEIAKYPAEPVLAVDIEKALKEVEGELEK